MSGLRYHGPNSLREPVVGALSRVVDPELALSIVDLGLVYEVNVLPDTLHVALTMTSPACPVADVIIEEAEHELDRVAPADLRIQVELVWAPVWTPELMSERAKRFLTG